MPSKNTGNTWEQVEFIDEQLYNQTKSLRSSFGSKRLRNLRSFERRYYNKTFEVCITGHGIQPEHQLNDGGLRHVSRETSYSLNKKKRWLLPDIIETRICQTEPTFSKEKTFEDKFTVDIDERLKIEMFINENTRFESKCRRYGNSQMKPHIIERGHPFNPKSLEKWINFNTRFLPRPRNPNHHNQPHSDDQFGIRQRPGFFQSEVKYEFLYPRRSRFPAGQKSGRTSIWYHKSPRTDDFHDRWWLCKRKRARILIKKHCRHSWADYDPQIYFSEQKTEVTDEKFTINPTDENERWSIVFDEPDDRGITLGEYLLASCISHNPTRSVPSQPVPIIPYDFKGQKHFEPLPCKTTEQNKIVSSDESVLCSIAGIDELEFLSMMQSSGKHILQANLSPALFVQSTIGSTFSVIYKYSRFDKVVHVIIKTSNSSSPPTLCQSNPQNLSALVDYVYTELNNQANRSHVTSSSYTKRTADALRGSLPLPLFITKHFVLVQPDSVDRETALIREGFNRNSTADNPSSNWFNTILKPESNLECSVCCEELTDLTAHQLLPCLHTLCAECLSSFIRINVTNLMYASKNTSALSCCYTNCSTLLNNSLIEAFVSNDIYQTFHQSMIDRRLFSIGRYRKCPSQSCMKLLIVGDSGKPSLMCTCGQRACSTCLEEYHFPATCEQYKRYSARLRQSGDDLLSKNTAGDTASVYVAEGKNCPNCGEFVEKNGGCPHMTCRCGNEYCWMCLKRWASHNSATCTAVNVSTYELRSSMRNRLHNKAIERRRERNEISVTSLEAELVKVYKLQSYSSLILSAYIDLNTMAEFLYVFLQRRRTDVNIRAVLARTARQLEFDASSIKIRTEQNMLNLHQIQTIRKRIQRTLNNLIHMKKTGVLI